MWPWQNDENNDSNSDSSFLTSVSNSSTTLLSHPVSHHLRRVTTNSLKHSPLRKTSTSIDRNDIRRKLSVSFDVSDQVNFLDPKDGHSLRSGQVVRNTEADSISVTQDDRNLLQLPTSAIQSPVLGPKDPCSPKTISFDIPDNLSAIRMNQFLKRSIKSRERLEAYEEAHFMMESAIVSSRLEKALSRQNQQGMKLSRDSILHFSQKQKGGFTMNSNSESSETTANLTHSAISRRQRVFTEILVSISTKVAFVDVMMRDDPQNFPKIADIVKLYHFLPAAHEDCCYGGRNGAPRNAAGCNCSLGRNPDNEEDGIMTPYASRVVSADAICAIIETVITRFYMNTGTRVLCADCGVVLCHHRSTTNHHNIPKKGTTVIESIVVPIGGQLVILGDTHGQIEDVLWLIFREGLPCEKNVYIFNGDIIDRGDHAIDILLIVLMLKLRYPHAIYITRGNHEDEYCLSNYGFAREVLYKFGKTKGDDVIKMATLFFHHLPLCAVLYDWNDSFIVKSSINSIPDPLDSLFLENEEIEVNIVSDEDNVKEDSSPEHSILHHQSDMSINSSKRQSRLSSASVNWIDEPTNTTSTTTSSLNNSKNKIYIGAWPFRIDDVLTNKLHDQILSQHFPIRFSRESLLIIYPEWISDAKLKYCLKIGFSWDLSRSSISITRVDPSLPEAFFNEFINIEFTNHHSHFSSDKIPKIPDFCRTFESRSDRRIFLVHGGIPLMAGTTESNASVFPENQRQEKGVLLSSYLNIYSTCKIPVPAITAEHVWFYQSLWSDPVSQMTDRPLGRGTPFGPEDTDLFCSSNNISGVIRSHQVPSNFIGYEVMHNGKLITVFSASNYCRTSLNCGSTVLLDSQNFRRLCIAMHTGDYSHITKQNVKPNGEDLLFNPNAQFSLDEGCLVEEEDDVTSDDLIIQEHFAPSIDIIYELQTKHARAKSDVRQYIVNSTEEAVTNAAHSGRLRRAPDGSIVLIEGDSMSDEDGNSSEDEIDEKFTNVEQSILDYVSLLIISNKSFLITHFIKYVENRKSLPYFTNLKSLRLHEIPTTDLIYLLEEVIGDEFPWYSIFASIGVIHEVPNEQSRQFSDDYFSQVNSTRINFFNFIYRFTLESSMNFDWYDSIAIISVLAPIATNSVALCQDLGVFGDVSLTEFEDICLAVDATYSKNLLSVLYFEFLLLTYQEDQEENTLPILNIYRSTSMYFYNYALIIGRVINLDYKYVDFLSDLSRKVINTLTKYTDCDLSSPKLYITLYNNLNKMLNKTNEVPDEEDLSNISEVPINLYEFIHNFCDVYIDDFKASTDGKILSKFLKITLNSNSELNGLSDLLNSLDNESIVYNDESIIISFSTFVGLFLEFNRIGSSAYLPLSTQSAIGINLYLNRSAILSAYETIVHNSIRQRGNMDIKSQNIANLKQVTNLLFSVVDETRVISNLSLKILTELFPYLLSVSSVSIHQFLSKWRVVDSELEDVEDDTDESSQMGSVGMKLLRDFIG